MKPTFIALILLTLIVLSISVVAKEGSSDSKVAQAYNKRGDDFYFGRGGVRQDYSESVKWFRMAADMGYASGQGNLGVMYRDGKGVLKDYKEAVKWFRRASLQGNATAQYNLGVMYENGRGVPEDYKEAVNWYRKAALQGYSLAQYNLGVKYDNGEGVLEDDKEAVKWYRKAALQGHDSAQYNLGVMYANGEGVPEDDKEAMNWYLKAAQQGHSTAQNNIGANYANGEGVPENLVSAYAWYNIAAANGSTLGKRNKDIIAKRMTPAQITQAQALSRTLSGQKGVASSIIPAKPANVDKATKDAEYDLLKRLAGFEKQLGRISRAKVETYLEMVHIYVWRAAEFKSDARGAALIKAQSMLFLGAGNLETQDDPTNALRLYAAAEAVAAIANTVVTDGTYKKLIAKNNQDIGKLKQGLLAGRLRNISRKPLQGVYDRGFKKIYRIYRHEENPVK